MEQTSRTQNISWILLQTAFLAHAKKQLKFKVIKIQKHVLINSFLFAEPKFHINQLHFLAHLVSLQHAILLQTFKAGYTNSLKMELSLMWELFALIHICMLPPITGLFWLSAATTTKSLSYYLFCNLNLNYDFW